MFIHFVAVHFSAAENSKNTKNLYFGGLRSFEVIDVDTSKKHVTNVCYDKQQVCVYLQTFLTLDKPIAKK